jgi:eukaryotic-like serine/threonine-protein kinase
VTVNVPNDPPEQLPPTKTIADPGANLAPDSTAAPAASTRNIGPYQLIRKLGEGGMGEVWLAQQTAPVQRLVALKLILSGRFDTRGLQRFHAEQQSLAVMNHPAIAKVFDAGATPEGEAYFVMEYVEGLPITRYCDQKKLKLRQRLELFIEVCQGVQHAHQKAIIHRDLKPSNILVAEVDGHPAPRIIDFGIAKALSEQSASEQDALTQVGGFVGTPGYMSPEQADPSVLDVDTRTDVYSLGVVLYELLTGLMPFDARQWKKRPFDEVLRHLREDDPPTPSSRVSKEHDTLSASIGQRETDPKQLVSMLRGDLDQIALKAVDKDRNLRYGTPSELAADITLYLNHEPVLARPASTAYRLAKYVQRHRLGVAAAATLVLLLSGFGITELLQLRRVTRERDRADRVTTFMTDMFKVSDPGEARGNSITAREILDKASKEIDPGLSKDPELQAQMMHVMGTVYDKLGLYPEARSLFTRAVDIRRRVLGPRNPGTLTSMGLLGWILMEQGHYPEAEKLNRETLEMQRRVLGRQHPDTLGSMSNLGMILNREGRYTEAEKLSRETLEIRRRVLGPQHTATLISMNNLAIVLSDERHYAEAEELRRETLEIRRRVSGPEHPATLEVMNNLATSLHDDGHVAEAEKLGRETLEIQRRVSGPEHPDTLLLMANLANYLHDEGRDAEAEKLDRETLEIRRRVLGPQHPDTLVSMDNLSILLDDEGRYAEAEKLERSTLDIRRRVLGPEHPDTVSSTYNLACFAARNGKRNEALALLREAVDHGQSVANIQTDSDLESLHGDARFEALVAHAKERAAAAQKPK